MSFAEMLVTQRRESSLDKILSLVKWERLRYRLKKILDRSSEGRPAYRYVSGHDFTKTVRLVRSSDGRDAL